MANEQVQGNHVPLNTRKTSPVTSILDTAFALRFVAGKLDEDLQYGPACILSVLSDHLRDIGEQLDNEEWQPAEETSHA